MGSLTFHLSRTRVAPSCACKAKCLGRIFTDWLRNGRGATAIAGWSLRARPGGALTWEEFARIRKPDRFSLKDAAAREWPAFIDTMVAKAPKLPL